MRVALIIPTVPMSSRPKQRGLITNTVLDFSASLLRRFGRDDECFAVFGIHEFEHILHFRNTSIARVARRSA